MKTINFIIFFSVFLTIYSLTNYYIFIRGWHAIPQQSLWRTTYLLVFLLLASAFIVGRLLERVWLSVTSDIFVWIGSFWFGAMIYFFLIVLFIDILRIVNHWLPFFSLLNQNIVQLKGTTMLVSIGLVLLLLFIGYVNACFPRPRQLHLSIAKSAPAKTIKIVAASDIHLGTIVGRKRFCKIVNKINELNPDLILLPGDIVDEDLAPVIRENLGDALLQLKSKFGVYAITGNHEYIGGVEQAVTYLEAHGVTVLRDSVVKIDGGIYIVGREDRSIRQFDGKRRKKLSDLMSQVDKKSPVILMDHQPFGLNESRENGVDLQLSGHTHHGQLFPVNFMTSAVFEKSWGYVKKGDTHVYVSCGVGTWGPPVRLGSRPEILEIVLDFDGAD